MSYSEIWLLTLLNVNKQWIKSNKPHSISEFSEQVISDLGFFPLKPFSVEFISFNLSSSWNQYLNLCLLWWPLRPLITTTVKILFVWRLAAISAVFFCGLTGLANARAANDGDAHARRAGAFVPHHYQWMRIWNKTETCQGRRYKKKSSE